MPMLPVLFLRILRGVSEDGIDDVLGSFRDLEDRLAARKKVTIHGLTE